MTKNQKILRRLLHFNRFVISQSELFSGESTSTIISDSSIKNPAVRSLIKEVSSADLCHHRFSLANSPYHFYISFRPPRLRAPDSFAIWVDYNHKRTLFSKTYLNYFIDFLKREQ